MNLEKLEEFLLTCEKDDKFIKSPIIYTLTKTKKKRTWRGFIFTSPNDDLKEDWFNNHNFEPPRFDSKLYGFYFSISGQIDGKQTISTPKIIKAGKNIGKKNETTPFQQALQMLKTEFEKKIKEGGSLEEDIKIIENFDDLPNKKVNVMLLQDAKKHPKKVEFPCIVQPKYDGIHLVIMYYEQFYIFSRGRKEVVSQCHLPEELQILKQYPKLYLTGEALKPNMNRQEISSAFNSQFCTEETKLDLYIFDCFYINKDPFEKRLEILKELSSKIKSSYIHFVESKFVNSWPEIENYFQENKDKEGIIIRNLKAPYEFGITKEIRSFGVLKYKNRESAEFKIIGCKTGQGKYQGLIIFELHCEGGNFSANPKWTEEQKKEAWLNKEKYIGCLATVEYDGLSSSGIPIQPVVVEVYF